MASPRACLSLPQPPTLQPPLRPGAPSPATLPPPGLCLQKLPGPLPRAGPTQRCPQPHCLSLASRLGLAPGQPSVPGNRRILERESLAWSKAQSDRGVGSCGLRLPGERMSQGLGGARGRAIHPGADTVPLQKGPRPRPPLSPELQRAPQPQRPPFSPEFPGDAPAGGPRACGWGACSKPFAGLGSRGLWARQPYLLLIVPRAAVAAASRGGTRDPRPPGGAETLPSASLCPQVPQ